ncbi:MAG: MotA/TolQ/ExbB proton channel family protein [Magnetococcus sp. WYHC-3]
MNNSQRRFSLTHTVGTIGVIAAIFVSAVLAGVTGLRDFIKLAPLILVAGITFFMLLAGFGKTFLAFIPDSLLTLFTTPARPNPAFVELAQSGGQYAMAAGVLGTVLGLIEMLCALSDAANIGPALACAFLAILYGIIASELCGECWGSAIELSDQVHPFSRAQKRRREGCCMRRCGPTS